MGGMIGAKDSAAINSRVETPCAGNNSTIGGGMRRLHWFAKKLGMEEKLKHSIKLSASEGEYTDGRRWAGIR